MSDADAGGTRYDALGRRISGATPAERLIRLDELDSLGAALLLAYLDGRVPEMIDDWFAGRAGKAGSPLNDGFTESERFRMTSG